MTTRGTSCTRYSGERDGRLHICVARYRVGDFRTMRTDDESPAKCPFIVEHVVSEGDGDGKDLLTDGVAQSLRLVLRKKLQGARTS